MPTKSTKSTPPLPLFEVRQSEIHNRGVFAAADLPFDTRILEYTGEKITKREAQRRGVELMENSRKNGDAAVYMFTLNSRYDLDGAVGENPARYINHSCDPNCVAYIEKGHVYIYAKRAIQKGEELTYNYGFDLETWEEHLCLCGTDRCVGFIADEKHWPQLRRIIKRHKASQERHARELAAAVVKAVEDAVTTPKPAKPRKSRAGH